MYAYLYHYTCAHRFDLFFTEKFAVVNVHLESLDSGAALRMDQVGE